MNKLLVTLSFIFLSGCVSASDLKPFTTDGCSAFPDGTISQQDLWLQCCIEHDKAYWAGGTAAMRKQADKDLEACVSKVGEPKIAQLMLAGVRVGGTPYLPTTFRWGYGWPYPRGYNPLTEEETALVEKELKNFESSNPQ